MYGTRVYFSRVCLFVLQSELVFAAFENVATNKPAYQSSFYDTSVLPEKAVDGDITQQPGSYCILTNINQPFTWWEVNLGHQYFIHEVIIYFRTEWKWRRNGIQVYTSRSPRQGNSGTPCGAKITGGDDGSGISDITLRTCDVYGQYVTVYQEDNNPRGSTAMDFCEVQVKACPLTKYGEVCDKLCADRHCAQTSTCGIWTGSCIGGCLSGWRVNDCTKDVDECTEPTPCHVNEICANTAGSYTCTCPNGFTGIGFNCTDVNECLKNPCGRNSICENTVGSYTCPCRDGFVKTGNGCTDVNECNTGQYPCDSNADCDNTAGSFTCRCRAGHSGDGHTCTACQSNVTYGVNCTKLCSDRKCASSAAPCDTETGACDGDCRKGWRGADCSQDVNECHGQNTCDTNANCSNTVGSYTCECRSGFSGDGKTCTACQHNVKYGHQCSKLCEDRKCDSTTSSCDPQTGVCDGGCQTGWEGSDCIQDVDECLVRNACHTNADCQNTVGSYACSCRDGYSGNGTTCDDINECAERNPCDDNSNCTNTEGSYTCTCWKGYYWDGNICTAPPLKENSVNVASLAIIGVLAVFLLIAGIVIIRLVMIVRKQRNRAESKIKFSDIRQNETQPTSSPSVYYEDVNADSATVSSRPAPSRRSPPQAPSEDNDYQNEPRTTEISEEKTNTYDRLDTDAVSERSPYEKINV